MEELKAVENSIEPESSIAAFLKEVKTLFPILELKQNFRATHRGLFVAEAAVGSLLRTYQSWLEKQSAGEIHKSEEKTKKRLFSSTEPERFYLIEGKNVLSGFLVSHEMREPQKLGIPYYLGSLTAKKNYIHPSDPIFGSIKDVEVLSEGSGVGLRIKVGNNTFYAKSEIIQNFLHVVRHSQRTLKEFPDIEESLAELCKTFVHMFRKSRNISDKDMPLIPENLAGSRKCKYRMLGKIVFVCDPKNNIIKIYGLWGSNLYKFMRREYSHIRGGRIGSFEIYPERHKYLGRFKYSENQYQLSTKALIDFYEQIETSPDKKDKLARPITARSLFERFSELLQTSQSIKRNLIADYVTFYKKPIREYRINGVWIFIISRDGIIDASVSKIRRL